jgi:uncharacterized protein (DUF1697 family)
MIDYVAFLRGINVGGRRIIKMEELARHFGSFGHAKIRTYIASGNVLFSSPEKREPVLTKKIELDLEKALGYRVDVFLRSIGQLQAILDSRPFARAKLSPDAKAYVTFFNGKPAALPDVPSGSPAEGYRLLRLDERELFSIWFRKPNGGFVDSAARVEKTMRIPTTTRNWNTIVKILNL